MYTSQLLLTTQKQPPKEAQLVSHQLMLRAGMIFQQASGIYSWLPLGLRVLKRVEAIIRSEMEKLEAQEVLMPIVQPASLWQESKRLEQYGPELCRFEDRNQRKLCLGSTHEEVITDIIRSHVQSYKQLPLILYQIQTKFRDEIRPRFGLIRAREFIMKDAYSFHLTQASLKKTYQLIYEAYCRIFERLGLNYRAVWADSGAIGGDCSQEFHVLAESGEDIIAYSDQSDYAANLEKASALPPSILAKTQGKALKKITISQTTDPVSVFHISRKKILKTYLAHGAQRDTFVALVLRSDHTLNCLKAEQLEALAQPLSLATHKEIQAIYSVDPTFLGPIGLDVPLIVDREAAVLDDFICPANQTDQYYQHGHWLRDAKITEIADLRYVVAGDLSPDGQGVLQLRRGIEVGHIFQNGDQYTKPMHAFVLNEQGQKVTIQSGCYGIGISRLIAAAIEQSHDERGIIWKEAIAPFQIALVPIHLHQSSQVASHTEALYQKLLQAGYEVLLDDRKERPGVMFFDMDLIGIPHRLVVSESGIQRGQVEYQSRRLGQMEQLPFDKLLSALKERIS